MLTEPSGYYKLVVEYDGTAFHGWQIQPDLRTVQGSLIEALKTISQGQAKVQGASRTDRGVHARGQVASAETFGLRPLLPIKLRSALNAVLPHDISIREVATAKPGFHPRHDARGKHYRYLIANAPWRPALQRDRSWHRPKPLNIDAMQLAANALCGEHDFRAFAASGELRPTTRNVRQVKVSRSSEDATMVQVDVVGDGFLWNMVRIMVGTLVEVGRGQCAANSIPSILASRDRRRAGPTAPPQGLALMNVYYEEPSDVSFVSRARSGFVL